MSMFINFTVLIVGLLAITGDITLTWTSPMYPKLYSNDSTINPLGEPITEYEDGWIGSLINIGAIVGPLPFGIIAEKIGRRPGLLCIAIPHIAAFLTMAFAEHVYLFYFGRLLGGLALGGGYCLLPMYIAEITEDSNRGMYSVTLGVFWSFGNFIPYAVGPFMSVKAFNILLACVPLLFIVLFFCFGTETPYYLSGADKLNKAEKSLMKLRASDEKSVRLELEMINSQVKRDDSGTFMSIIKNRGLRKALFICIALILFEELSGIPAITFYLQPIFEASGTRLSSDLSSVAVGICLFASSLLTPFFVDRIGRRMLLLISSVGMFLPLVMLGYFFYIHESTEKSTDSIFWIPIVSLIFYILSFAFGISIIPWTITSELFPTHVKQIAASTVSSTCWVASFLITKFFNDMNNSMGSAATFWFYGCCCLLCAVFSAFMVPETKGKSFREIQEMLRA